MWKAKASKRSAKKSTSTRAPKGKAQQLRPRAGEEMRPSPALLELPAPTSIDAELDEVPF